MAPSADETGKTCIRALISGRVQGVGFRAFLRDRATSLGLEGWVRNLASGEVEAVFHGPAGAVEAMLEQCRLGPRWRGGDC